MIKGIQDETKTAVEKMQISRKEIKEETILANKAGLSLQQIEEAVQNITEMVQQIDAAARKQSSTGEDITVNLHEIAEKRKTYAEDIHTFHNISSKLSDLSQQLQNSVTKFKFSANGG